MKTLFLFITIFFATNSTLASQIYITGNRLDDAIFAVYGAAGGVGDKTDSCLLCHNTSAGGSGNMNAFGDHFLEAADRLGISPASGLSATGTGSLETIFDDATFQDEDSDLDGIDNGTEIEGNQDPASNTSSSSGGSSGGGCGMIAPPSGGSNFPPTTALLVLLPFGFLIGLRRRA